MLHVFRYVPPTTLNGPSWRIGCVFFCDPLWFRQTNDTNSDFPLTPRPAQWGADVSGGPLRGGGPAGAARLAALRGKELLPADRHGAGELPAGDGQARWGRGGGLAAPKFPGLEICLRHEPLKPRLFRGKACGLLGWDELGHLASELPQKTKT